MNILVIEDEPDIRKNLEYNLSREGFTVSSAGSLKDGLKSLDSNTYSLILLDLMLPDGSGLDLCKKIKSNSSLESIPIIILTAKDDEVDKVVGFELGADDYVTKPFSVRELILRIKAVLKRGQKDSNEIVEVERQFGDLRIDIESHEVHVDSKLVELTALEFKLLNVKPELWTPADVISRHQGLLGNIEQELNIGRAVSKIGEEKTVLSPILRS